MMAIRWILACILAYLIGSINVSIIYSKTVGHFDIRTRGSGNAGTTNMLRSVGKRGAAITLLGDVLKACLAIFVASLLVPGDTVRALAGLCCIIGHCFPLYFSFKGGKGIASGAGVALMLDWRTFLALVITFTLVLVITRYVSAGSLAAAFIFPFSLWFFGAQPGVVLCIIPCIAIVFFMHRANIVRLIKGEENKLVFHKKGRE